MQMRRLFFALAFLLLAGVPAWAEVVVVVDARAGIETLSRDEVANIFLGRRRALPGGLDAYPVDLPGSVGAREEFYRKLVDKSLSEISAYWARLYFSGKTRPPAQSSSYGEVVRYVLGTTGGIGYLPRDQVDARLRVVLSLP